MAKVIVAANQKGGVGKTTTIQSIAVALQALGNRVLLIDMDPQTSLTSICGAVRDVDDNTTKTILHVLTGQVSTIEAIQTLENGISIIPSSLYLANLDTVGDQIERPYLLQTALESVRDDYDYILIDSPPALGTFTINTLIAADKVIIPVILDIMSLQGMQQIISTINSLKKRANPKLEIAGILITKHTKQSKLSKEILPMFEEMAAAAGTSIFNSKIRQTAAVMAAQASGTDILTYSASSNAAIDYKSFVKEILTNM